MRNMKTGTTPRQHLLKLLANSVDSLTSLCALIDCGGTVTEILRTEPGVWEYLSEEAMERVTKGLGLHPPEE